MAKATRRGFLGAMAVAGGAAAGLATGESAANATTAGRSSHGRSECAPPPNAATIKPDDPRYAELITRGYNSRFLAQPESVRVVHSAEQVVQVVNEAVRAGKKIVVRSGGHCFENFVDDPATSIIIDVSEMNDVYFDPAHKAFAIEAGATLGQAYRSLYLGWGVTIPAGGCPSVGAGGHIAGGGYGPQSRRHGLVIDHLHGVEVVVVDRSGRARIVVATREARDPNRDLWWAHAGGGGGNFGIVTRYLMRSPNARGNDPATLLPRPPAQQLVVSASWSWENMTEEALSRLADNYARWQQQNHADPAFESIDSSLTMYHRSSGRIELFTAMDGDVPGADGILWTLVQTVGEGVGIEPTFDYFSVAPWLRVTLSYDSGAGAYALRFKSKAGYLRKPWTPAQLKVVYRYLTEGEGDVGASVYLMSLGGKINAVDPAATANPHRTAPLIGFFDVGWWDPAEDDKWLASIRDAYREMHADTGGVPVPGEAYDGAYINYPDNDLADPALNTSGVPWHKLYYKDNYPKLQQVKAKWDPRNVFNHALSVRLPGASDTLPSPPPQTRPKNPRKAETKKYPRRVSPRHANNLRSLGRPD
ncbi:FAD-binding oxidoreductase [Streptosporangium sp. NPDC000509]|uniref:FAD-binding oxidoreductase n=1 Tax=Streptosporangium sp. NPDC000509 TaxID=3366186 RepID=UPI0036A51A4A